MWGPVEQEVSYTHRYIPTKQNHHRWFLIHWLVYHILALILLFLTSILVFVVQPALWKLLGIVPVILALFTIYCWAKVTFC